MKQIRRGLRALWYWLPVIWRWNDWDYRYSLEVFEHSLKALYAFLSSDRAVALQRSKDLHNLRVLLLLLRRFNDGNYYEKCRKIDPYQDEFGTVDRDYLDWRYLEDQDWRMIWEQVTRYMRCWWD